MSWFGETFGDSLNSLKGQITKITKEVLVDNESSNNGSGSQESKNQLVKELQALCESKDLEIASLRDELNKLYDPCTSQEELLKAENITKGSVSTCDNYDLLIKKLENELFEVRQERDHLNSCLEELQAEHQINLEEVILLKDKYKSELEILKKEYNFVKTEIDDTLSNTNSVKEEFNQDKCNEISMLKSKINDLQLLLEKEKENSVTANKIKVKVQSDLKNQIKKSDSNEEKLDKLLRDIKVISKEKEMIEVDKNSIQKENEELKNALIEKEKENKEDKLNLKLLLNEKSELLNKCQNYEILESKLSNLIKIESEAQQKLLDLSQILNIEVKETLGNNHIVELINLIQNKVHQMSNKANEKWKESTNNLELEIRNLKEDNSNFQNKLKISIENAAEMEKKYQEDISLIKDSFLKVKTQEQDCISQSQTDDVKRLEQEVAQCMSLILAKNNEINEYSKLLNNAEQELRNIKASSLNYQEELLLMKDEKKTLEEEIITLKTFVSKITQEKDELKEIVKNLESEKKNLSQMKINSQKKVGILEKEIEVLKNEHERNKIAQQELKKVTVLKLEIEKKLAELQNENLNLKSELRHLKAEVIIKESSLTELIKTNTFFQEEINKIQAQNNDLMNLDEEVKKWKAASVELQIQMEDITAKKEELKNEYLKLKKELEITSAGKDEEIQQLKLTNSNLMKSYNELHDQLEIKTQGKCSFAKEFQTDKKYQTQEEIIMQLQEEKNELKFRIQKFQEQMKMQMFPPQNEAFSKDDAQQHRRSKSAVDTDLLDIQKAGIHNNEELILLKEVIQCEQAKCQVLQNQLQDTANKEANARKEFERLKKHLIEVEDHYTEEALENKNIINDLKAKLVAAEEQLQNSSTLYTSLKVRDNQHLESLQSQIRMVSVQRDDLQAKLSAAEDEIQKHKASLMSLQIVLEQFQQDKEREVEEVAFKYEKQLKSRDDHLEDLQAEILSLKNQLLEAKNGLKAASRLGEQLEKKSQQVSDLEEKLEIVNNKVLELENNLSSATQVNNSKIDKSLIKNLIIGYVLSPNAERKSQVLRILASVLDFDQDERTKMGVDTARSSWLFNIMHPKGEVPSSSQSLSEAFIKFLENESRPQPQLKFLPEQLEESASKPSRPSPKPSGRLTELTLPTFNSSQESESSVILKNVLKQS